MAEPDLKQGVDALKNRFDLEAPVTREERDAERIHYERYIAPRLESITESYDRITKRRQDAEMHKLKTAEVAASIAKLKEKKDTDEQDQAGLAAIHKSWSDISEIIDNIGVVPNPDDLEGVFPRTYVPASIPQMRDALQQARNMYNNFGLRTRILNSTDKVGFEKMFADKISQGEKFIATTETRRKESSTLMADYEDLLNYDSSDIIDDKGKVTGNTADQYKAARGRFESTHNMNEFRSVISRGK